MNQIRQNIDEYSPKPNPKNRVHRATWVLILFVGAVWLLLSFPGKRFDYSVPPSVSIEFFQHGWPLVHYERTTCTVMPGSPLIGKPRIQSEARLVNDCPKEVNIQEHGRKALSCVGISGKLIGNTTSNVNSYWVDEDGQDRPYWLRFGNWSLFGDCIRIRWIGLLFNVSIVSGILFVSGFLANWRFQRNGLRISLKELALFTVVIGVVCMYYSSASIFEKYRMKLEDLKVVKLYDKSERFEVYPEYLIRIFGRSNLPRSVHFRSLVVDFDKATPEERTQIKYKFSALRHIRIAKLTSLDPEIGACLKQLSNVNELSLIGPDLAPNQWTAVGGMYQLHTLRVSSSPERKRVVLGDQFFRAVSKCQSLTSLEIGNCVFSSEVLAHLGRIKKLNRLNINDHTIDDTTLEAIESFSALTYLSVRRGGIDDSQVGRLEKACPNLLIVH